MEIFKVVGIGIVAAILTVLVKQYRAEIGVQISLLATVVIFVMVAPYLKAVIHMFQNISSQIGMDITYLNIVLKVIGIAYVTQFGSELCKDAGESAIASKIELAGKIVILTLSMPIMYKLLSLINSIINFN